MIFFTHAALQPIRRPFTPEATAPIIRAETIPGEIIAERANTMKAREKMSI